MKWESVRLGDVATFVNGYPFKPTDWSSEGKEIIRIQNLTKSGGEVNYFQGTIPTKYSVRRGDILISWSATLDIFIWDGPDALLNQHIFKVVFDKIEIDKRFFYFLIQHVLDDLKEQVHGATMKHITKDKFDNTLIPLPPLPTQRRIAEILDTSDALRRKDQELLRKYDELAQAIFIDMFGDPVRNEKGWEVKRLEECSKQIKGSIRTGPFGSQLLIEELIESGVPVYGIDNVQSTGFTWAKPKFISSKKYEELISFKINEGDVLITRTGTVGRSCVAPKNIPESIIGPNLLRVSLNPKILIPEVLSFMLNNFDTVKNKIKSMSPGATVAVFNSDNLKGLELITPPYKLQNTFLDIYTNLNTQKLTFIKNESESLFNRLLQKSFSGELVA